MSSSVIVQVRHRYAAPAERVFDAWLNPSQAARFLFATRTGNVMQCEMNPVVGGGFTVTDRRPQADGDESVFDVVHRGNFIAIDRPRRIVFDFAVVSYSDQFTRVTLEFVPTGSSCCELTLSHDMGDTEEAFVHEESSRRGWTRMLASLEREFFPRRVSI